VSDSFVRSTSSDCNVSSLSLVNSSLASLVVGASLSFYRGFPLLLVSGSFLILIGVGGWFCMDWSLLDIPHGMLVGVDANYDLVFINCNSITSQYCFPSKMNSSPMGFLRR
jgi:hypothetical protein